MKSRSAQAPGGKAAFAKPEFDRAKSPRRAPPGAVSAVAELEILEIGARGDGAARTETGPVYAPYVLAGERVRARVAGDRGVLLEVLRESPERVVPPCAHFGRCGGCQLQHWAHAPYLEWKRAQVVRALERRGLDAPVDPIVAAAGLGRRRAVFHAVRGGRFGFLARGGGEMIDIGACPVLTPRLEAALGALRRIGAMFAPAKGEATLACLDVEAGLDVDVKGAGAATGLTRQALEAAARLADETDLARLSLDGEALITRRIPEVAIGLARVRPPPGAFLQPTQAGEEALAALTLSALAGCERVVDLFCGMGTFALRLAGRAEVRALDGGAAMLAALKAGADAAAGALAPVSVERRDLLRTPLSALEMKKLDGAAFDPPRSGARLQAEQIARSNVSKVAAISCDPATFARDARVLVDHGFTLTRVSPVDQFQWSPHVEVVGAFER